MPSQATMIPQQQLIAAAKAPLLAFNDKNWTAVKAAVTTDFVYDEVATKRKVQGADKAIALWQGWAKAFPDSRATFHGAVAGGETVVLEVTWHGTHNGPLETPNGPMEVPGGDLIAQGLDPQGAAFAVHSPKPAATGARTPAAAAKAGTR